MEASELRIGNWVRLVSKDKDFEITSGYEIDLGTESCDFEPIPLTEEWLERFGFKEFIDFGSHTGHYDKLPLCGFSYSINTKKVMVMHKGNGISHWIDLKVEYVHQLQNLYFALTGEELTIKTN